MTPDDSGLVPLIANRAVNTAEASYSSAAGQGGYAVDLKVLGAACPGSAQGFISPDLGDIALPSPVVKSGYNVLLAAATSGTAGPNDCNTVPTQTDYYGTTVPVTLGTTGNRSFSSNAAGTIFFNNLATAPTEAEMARGGGGTPIQ